MGFTWISGVLVCNAQKIYDPVSLDKQIETNIGWFGPKGSMSVKADCLVRAR